MEIFLANAEATIALGQSIAQRLQEGDIVSLLGDLGAGKTTLTKGIIAGLGGSVDDVSSPTFNLVHEYQTPSLTVLHCDFYRLKPEDELEDLGGTEFFYQPRLYLIEWLNRLSIVNNIHKKRIFTIDLQTLPEGRMCRLPEHFRIS